MSEVISKIQCQECGNEITENCYCYYCNKLVKANHFSSITDTIELVETLKGKIRKPNKRPHLLFKEEDQNSGDPKILNGVHKSMHIDRDNDRYLQKVVDRETGKVLHFEDTKLSQHKT